MVHSIKNSRLCKKFIFYSTLILFLIPAKAVPQSCGDQLSGTISQLQMGNKVDNRTFHVDGNLTIDIDFEFENCELYMDPGVVITVDAGVSPSTPITFLLDNTILTACETQMWQGIVLDDEFSQVRFEDNSLLEHAEVGVYTEWSSQIQIDKTTFNRNWIHVHINTDPGPSGHISNLLNWESYIKDSEFVSCQSCLYAPYANQNPLWGIRSNRYGGNNTQTQRLRIENSTIDNTERGIYIHTLAIDMKDVSITNAHIGMWAELDCLINWETTNTGVSSKIHNVFMGVELRDYNAVVDIDGVSFDNMFFGIRSLNHGVSASGDFTNCDFNDMYFGIKMSDSHTSNCNNCYMLIEGNEFTNVRI